MLYLNLLITCLIYISSSQGLEIVSHDWLNLQHYHLHPHEIHSLSFSMDIEIMNYNESSNIVMYSDFSSSYKEKSLNYTICKIDYAKYHGYTYLNIINSINRTAANESSVPSHYVPHSYFYYSRVYSLKRLLEGTLSKEISMNAKWIVYFDADAFFAQKKVPLEYVIENIGDIKSIQHDDGNTEDCEFIAQDDQNVPDVNSGFFIILNSTWGYQFVENWIKSIKSPYNDHRWAHDQGALLNSILHYSANSRKRIYNDDCFKISNPNSRNICWYKTMRVYGYKDGNKKIGPICLIPNMQGIPHRFHSHDVQMYLSELVLHSFNIQPQMIYPGSFNYSYKKKRIRFPDGMLVKSIKSPSVYLLEHRKKRVFYNATSFLSKGYDWNNITIIYPSVLEKIPVGEMIY